MAGASVHESRIPEQLAWQGYFRTTTAQLIGLPAPCTGGSNVYPKPAKNRIGSGFNTGGWSTVTRPLFVVPAPMLVKTAISHPSAKAAIGPSRVPVVDNPASCAAGTCCTPDATAR